MLLSIRMLSDSAHYRSGQILVDKLAEVRDQAKLVHQSWRSHSSDFEFYVRKDGVLDSVRMCANADAEVNWIPHNAKRGIGPSVSMPRAHIYANRN